MSKKTMWIIFHGITFFVYNECKNSIKKFDSRTRLKNSNQEFDSTIWFKYLIQKLDPKVRFKQFYRKSWLKKLDSKMS